MPMDEFQVLHITPHMGGGVGKALSQLAAAHQTTSVRHVFVILEEPKNTQFFDRVIMNGNFCAVTSDPEEIRRLCEKSDIVQIEYWNHPKTAKLLACLHGVSMRLVVWCHISGLFAPYIPVHLFESAMQFVCTSTITESCNLYRRFPNVMSISSGSVNADTLNKKKFDSDKISLGYLGSLEQSKLHPRFFEILNTLPEMFVPVRIYGTVPGYLERSRNLLNQSIKFEGYTQNPEDALSTIEILPYLLSENHYGTAENALVEAMACGVVPVVLNNPAECAIVDHNKTGIVLDDLEELPNLLISFDKDRGLLRRLSSAASEYARAQFTSERLGRQFLDLYIELMRRMKTTYISIHADLKEGEGYPLFSEIYKTSVDAHEFLAGLYSFAEFPPWMLDENKGSLFHFYREFKNDGVFAQAVKIIFERRAV